MAEFKLGRIKFVYRNNWATDIDYVVDDVVTVSGKTYICVLTHTSSATFAEDQEAPAKWNLAADGTTWTGDWTPASVYNEGDLVLWGGIVYVCKTAHTSATYQSPTYLGLEANESFWDIFAANFYWAGAWTTNTRYKQRDLVTYGGTTYVCNQWHISAGTSSTLAVNGASGNGTTATLTFSTQAVAPFEIGATITVANVNPSGYNNASAIVTACTTSSVSYLNATTTTFVSNGSITGPTELGLEKDIDNWDTFNQGVTYQGTWTTSTRYKLNDVVKYGANLWIATVAHTSLAFITDESNWDIFVDGFEFEDSWDDATEYQVGDSVTYGGNTYTAIQNHVGQIPSTATAYWKVFTTGFEFAGDWTNATEYRIGDVVRLGGYTYVATADSTAGSGTKPPNLTYWQQLNAGLKYRANTHSYSAVNSVAVTSGGTNAKFDVVASGSIYTVTVTSGQGGSGYNLNDVIKVLGSSVGGISPANDIIITVTGVLSTAVTNVTVTGNSVTWVSGTTYVLGDVVFFGANSYICISAHVASGGSRPDGDVTGTTWNLLASGAESAVLTTQGDTFFYGENGPQRLPIGTDGQILRVKNGAPAWTYYGLINNLVYVANTGIDSPSIGQGLTIDKPWKTVRYACEQIEKGYLNRDASLLLSKNKQFILKEVNNYIQYTYPGVCDPTKTERDAGIVIDAVIYDLSHGGTLDTTTATLAYYDSTGTSYINLSVAAQITEFIAAQTYMASLISDVLNNVAPLENYQTLNSVVVQAEQNIDTSLVPEAGSEDNVLALMDIVINGLDAGTTASIAVATQPNTTISVKTGTYNEVLPIVIPRNTAVVGDELRSSVIQPQRAIAELANDTPKTISALNRIKAIVPSLMANSNITETTGNTQTQVTTLPAGSIGSTAATTAVSTSADIIYDLVDNGLSGTPSFVFTAPTGYNTSFLAGYGDGKAQVVANYVYIKAEISAYIALNYGSLWSSLGAGGQANCQRDIGYILDALQHDMTYGGNVQTLIAGSSYYSNYVSTIAASERTAILDAYARLKTVVGQIVLETNVTETVGNTETQDISGTPGSAGASTFAQARIQDVIDWITNATAPTASYPTAAIALATAGLQTAYTKLQSKRTEIADDTVAWVKKYHHDMNFNSATCLRDAGLIIDALSYDLVLGTNVNAITAGRSYNRAISSAIIVLTEQKDAELGAINFIKYKAGLIAASGASAQVSAIIDNVTAYITGTTLPEVHGTITYDNTLATINGAEILRANKTYLSHEATAWITQSYGGTVTTTTASTDLFALGGNHNFVADDQIVFSGTPYAGSGITVGTTYYVLASGLTSTAFKVSETAGGTAVGIITNGSGSSLVVRYSFDAVLCRRDMEEYVDALVYDLQYTGNYRSLRAAQLYVNAVEGSQLSDMFQVSNASGLRNCTLAGLAGTLTAANEYGTKRPTAGAFVALNPGFGPNDSKVWVNSRSHYSQNVTMFGAGCSGAKIDAALHTGGNKSMVKNDFTTIISDGIGVWCTGSGSLTELVSVFNYYGYAGYLAELGGRIRATNGNSSYGTYGVIAEGTDTYEDAIIGAIDNRSAQAQIGVVVTDALNEVLRFEYTDAGVNYTNYTPSISGSGYNSVAVGDEFRDAAVFNTRVIDFNNGTDEGGSGYVTATNVAQSGTTGVITIAATDILLSSAYVGMRVQITAGTGVGQYANILTYNNGTKEAFIIKDSFATLTVTGTTAGGNNLLTVASTATLYVGMPIYLGANIGGLTANTLYYVIAANFSSTQFAVSTSSGGLAAPTTLTSGQTVSLYAAGWDHAVPGSEASNLLDLTTAYIIEPRISYTAPGYTATARTLSGSGNTWESIAYGSNTYVAIASGATTTSYSTNGTTWQSAGAQPSSQTWSKVVFGGGEGATATAVVGGLGGNGAILEAVIGTGTSATQIIAINVIEGGINYTTAPTIVITSASGSGARATARVLNGSIAEVVIDINGSGYLTLPTVTAATDRITRIEVTNWGKNYFSNPSVTIVGGGYTTQATVKAFGLGLEDSTLTNSGVSSLLVDNAGEGYTSTPTVVILDTAARFVAISSASTNATYQTVAGAIAGSTWTASGSGTGKSNLTSITYGNGIYVAVGGASGTASAVQSSDGVTWIDRSANITALSGGNYGAVTYGAGVFVAINYGGIITSFSSNGNTWTAGGNLPNVGSNFWTSIAYGNGRFVAIQGAGGASRSVAYSIDKGVTWTASPIGLPSSQTWQNVRYGQGLFFAVASGTGVCATSPDGVIWTVQAMPVSSNWKGLTFGNPNNLPLWVSASNTSGTIAASIRTGATALGRAKVAAGTVTEIRMVEPGSGYPVGTVTAITGGASDLITTNDTTNLVNNQPIEFVGLDDYGLVANTTYYVIGATIVANTSFKVTATSGSSSPVNLTTGTGLSGSYTAGPIVTLVDPNQVDVAGLRVRTGNGVLGNPSFTNRGVNNATATANVIGDGSANLYQNSAYINVSGLYSIPAAGSNVEFASIPGAWYKLVSVTNILSDGAGNFTAQFQINPALSTLLAPADAVAITTKLKYSQVRLTGHDFLYIGTGNQSDTNYPFVDPENAIQANQTNSSGGGRVFFTSTDQDGNFNVGNLFGVQQATGTATLNASAFNLAGLQSLQLGAVTLGINSAIITQFSTDPYFTANSDAVVPTQKAIKAFITAQIGGGSSSLNVNTITSGQIYIANNTISNVLGEEIKITSKMNFVGGIDGSPVALVYFGQR
jgi:hypothetical protein